MNNYDLSLIDLIRNSSVENLLNQEYLEELLIPHLGVNDEDYVTWPSKLYPFFGKGLLCWQYPNQFSKYLIKLAEYRINSYMEIGVCHGGIFILTLEYLKKLGNNIDFALAVDISPPTQLMKDYLKINKSADYLHMGSQTEEFKNKLLTFRNQFDLVVIDAEHTYNAVMNDVNIVKDMSNIVFFHDICSIDVEVNQAWKYVEKNFAENHYFLTFTDQYNEVVRRYVDMGFTPQEESFLGIGLMIKNEFQPEKREEITSKKSTELTGEKRSSFFNVLGKQKMNKGLYKEAIESFVKGIKYNPEDPANYREISSCLMTLGDKQTAEKYMDLFNSKVK